MNAITPGFLLRAAVFGIIAALAVKTFNRVFKADL